MKRSRSIKLVLIGGIAAGALNGCSPGNVFNAPVTTDRVYTNNFYVSGVGYYHAPARTFFSLPYNHYDPTTKRWFAGGVWGSAPFQSITNISSPTASAVANAEAQRTDVSRGGFGRTSRSSHIWS